jgi:carbon monoxide dehydrogenase subunit G
MIVSGQMTVASPREELWAVLSDPGRLAQALPGVGDVSVQDERHFSAVAHPFTALGETRVALDFEIVEARPGEFVRIAACGRSGENLLQLSIALELASAGEETQASWRAELLLRGVLASLLQRGLGELLREQVESVLCAGARISESDRGS